MKKVNRKPNTSIRSLMRSPAPRPTTSFLPSAASWWNRVTCAARDLPPKKARKPALHPSATSPTTASPFWSDATTCKTTSSPSRKPAVGICGSTPKTSPAPIRWYSARAKRFPTAPCIRQPFWQQPTPKPPTPRRCRSTTPLLKMSKSRAVQSPAWSSMSAIRPPMSHPTELEKRLLVE